MGGCHQLQAVKRLHEEYPDHNTYAVREVQVYGKEITSQKDTVSYLANLHNILQGFQNNLSTRDEVSYQSYMCINLYKVTFRDVEGK